jgi:hypothetical protein
MFFNDFSRIVRGGDSGGSYSPPAAPDPVATAAAQSNSDVNTAQANALLLNPSVNSPYGTISYDQNSYQSDPSDTQTITRPTQSITLSPQEQSLFNYQSNIQNTLGGIGENYANTFQSQTPLTFNTSNIPTNINYSNAGSVPTMADYQTQANQASQAYYNQAMALEQPQLQLQQNQLNNQLIQSGNPLGSAGYENQMNSYMNNEQAGLNSLADQSIVQGQNIQNQDFNNANTTYQNTIASDQLPYETQQMLSSNQFSDQQQQQNQNINALSAIMQGSQAIQNPTSPTPSTYSQAAMTSPNIMGMTESNYQNELGAYNNQYNANTAASNAQTSGLFSLGGTLGAGLFGKG